jgi:hypothetical protein
MKSSAGRIREARRVTWQVAVVKVRSGDGVWHSMLWNFSIFHSVRTNATFALPRPLARFRIGPLAAFLIIQLGGRFLLISIFANSLLSRAPCCLTHCAMLAMPSFSGIL